MCLSDETQMQREDIRVNDIPISLIKQEPVQGFLDSNIERKHQTFHAEIEQHYVGPISADDFVPTYLPVDHERDDEMTATMTALVAIFSEEDTHSKNDVLKNLCDCINSSKECVNFKLRVPFENTVPSPPLGSSYPDICLYDETSIRPGSQLRNQSSILGCADLFLQYKTNAEMDDPFDDPDPEMDLSCFQFIRALEEDEDSDDEDNAEEEEAMFPKSLSDIAAFAAELFFRWDRAGVVISEAFDICEEPELFCFFIWSYTRATAAQRGYDTSVTMASIEEEIIFEESVRKHVKDQLSIEDDQELEGLVNEHYEPKSVYKMAVYPSPSRGIESVECNDLLYGTVSEPYPWDELWREVEAEEEHTRGSKGPIPEIGGTSLQSKSRVYSQVQYFLVSRPVVTPLKFACRGTRGYWAVKIPDESIGETDYHIAFVKDTWREDNKEADIEGETIVELIEAGVRFVSDIFCHGDVKPQKETDSTGHCVQNNWHTQTEKHNNAEWNLSKRKIVPLVHYRMASVEAGYPLSSLRGMKELIDTVRCGYLAAWASYVLRRRLHRDVSLNNFVLVKKNGKWRTGILIDWEFSSRAGKDGKALDSSRSGTWAFLSIAALSQKDFRHEFRDDMESFYYVLLFASIHWLPHDRLENIEKLVSDFFDEQDFFRGIIRGGCQKIANIGLNNFQSIWDFTNTSLRRCLEDIRKLQDSWTDQPDWIPQNFYSILESTDNEDLLPQDDRIDHVQTLRAERERRILANMQYYESIASKTGSLETSSNESQTSIDHKRNAEDAELEECVEQFKRQCCPISIQGE